jgi:hypothetical protein
VYRITFVVFLGASGPVARELQWQKPLKSYCTGTESPAVQGLRVQLYRD